MMTVVAVLVILCSPMSPFNTRWQAEDVPWVLHSTPLHKMQEEEEGSINRVGDVWPWAM